MVSTFIVGSDGHRGQQIWVDNVNGELDEVFIERIGETDAERVFLCGDILYAADYGDPVAGYAGLKADFDTLSVPWYAVRGNHDGTDAQFYDGLGLPIYYNVTAGDMVWIMLDSVTSGGAINATQMDYLSDALTYYSDKLCFVLWHVNQYKLAYPYLEGDNPTCHAILKAHSSHLGGVFSGHTHNYGLMTYEVDSVRYSYAGTYGSPSPDIGLGFYSFLLVEVYLDGADYIISIQGHEPESGEVVYGSGAIYTPDTGDSPVWNAATDDALASVAGNWLNGVPTAGKTAIFNDTSTKNCTWDIDVGNSLYVMDTFGKYVNQSVNTTFSTFSISSGWYKPSTSNRTLIMGNAVMSGTRIADNLARFVYGGNYTKIRFPTNVPQYREFIVNGTVDIQCTQRVSPTTGHGLNITGSLKISSGYRLSCYLTPTLLANFNIDGTVWGDGGELRYDCYVYYPLLPHIEGSIDCNLRIQSEYTRYAVMTEDLTVGGSLIVRCSNDAGSNTVRLYTDDYNISVGSMMIGRNGVLTANESLIECDGYWDSYNGSLEQANSSVTITAANTYIRLASGDYFNNLTLANTTIRLYTDHSQTVGFAGYSYAIAVTTAVQFNSTFWNNSPLAWNVGTDASVSFTVSGLDSSLGYRVFQDEDVIHTGDGPSLSFAAAGGGDFEVGEWYSEDVSRLVVLAVNMVGFGILMSLVGTVVMPLANAIRNRKEISQKVLMDNLVKAVIFTVVGLVMWTMLHEIVIG